MGELTRCEEDDLTIGAINSALNAGDSQEAREVLELLLTLGSEISEATKTVLEFYSLPELPRGSHGCRLRT